jgi:hypothetical protein
MLLYYFTSEFYGLKDIRERRLKSSNMVELNDPFEFVAAETADPHNRKIIHAVRDELAKENGLVCFSRNWHSPVQWGHYADKHKGLCLGFEIPSGMLRQVSYLTSRMPWPSEPWPWPQHVKQNFFGQLLASKFSHWSYEDEYRFFCSRLSPDQDSHCYVNFSDSLKLVKVLVGARSTTTRADLAEALGDLSSNVEVMKVRPAFRSFRIVKQRENGRWP